MSNHDGSYMLNEALRGLVEAGVLTGISVVQKRAVRDLLWHLTCSYDCNWGEIIDADLAMLLATCACCARGATRLSPDNGHCVRCDEEE